MELRKLVCVFHSSAASSRVVRRGWGGVEDEDRAGMGGKGGKGGRIK